MATFIASDGVALSADIRGPSNAPALVLLHSLGCDGGMWAPQVAALEADFRIVVPDSRGHGLSSAPDGDYTLDRLGRDVLDLIDALGLGIAHVCGLSMGGLVAQWLAINAPDRVDRLVLANTASRLGTTTSWQEREAKVHAHGMGEIAPMVLKRFLGDSFQKADPITTERVRQMLLQTSPQGYAGCCAALRCEDLTDQVARISKPTLVLGGSRDVSTPPEQAKSLQAAIRGAKLLILDAAHLSNVEQPDAFSAAVVGHLSRDAV